MNYELSELEKLIQHIAADQKEIHLEHFEAALCDEIRRIKSAWRTLACCEHDISFLKNYFRQHQLGLIGLGETLPPDNRGFYNVYTILEELHHFLLSSFPDFLDLGFAVPVQSLPSLKQKWQADLPVFVSQGKLLRLPETLQVAIFRPVHIWLEEQNAQPIRYHRLYFLLELKSMLSEFFDMKVPSLKATGILIDRLCHINFNSLVIYEAIKQLITEKAAAKDDLIAEIEFFRCMRDHFKRLPVRSDVYYRPDGRVMARSLADWLQRQVKAKEVQHHTLFMEEEPLTEEEMVETSKIMTSLSIEELGLFVRLFIETAVFKVKRNGLTGLTRCMSKNVRTMSKGVFDEYKPETLYKYIYSISVVTLRSVQNILKRMLKKLEIIETLIKSGKPIPPPNRR